MKEIIIDGVEYILTPKTEVSDKEEDIILVPDNIKLSQVWWSIAIHNWKHKLYYAYWFLSWVVWSNIWDELIKCKLVPCEWNDIEVGDTFYMNDESNYSFDILHLYAIKLDNYNHKYWSGNDCLESNVDFIYYWKVIQI